MHDRQVEILGLRHNFGPRMLCGGASISLLSTTSAAGCASQVGYQKEATSRFVW
jgi:hypothetical protein